MQIQQSNYTDSYGYINFNDINQKLDFINDLEHYARKGQLEELNQKISKHSFNSRHIHDIHEKNGFFGRMAPIFAKHGFIREAEQCVKCIQTDYSKFDYPFDSYIDEQQNAWKNIIYELLKKKIGKKLTI